VIDDYLHRKKLAEQANSFRERMSVGIQKRIAK
jgi:hypothetical protein